MGKVWMPGGGGGADLDVVTVTDPWDIAAGKVIVDKNGNPLTGTLTDRAGWTGSVGMNGSIAVPDGRHKNSKVNGPAVTQRGAWTGRIGVNGKAAIPEGYHNGSGYVDQAINNRGAWATSIGVNGRAAIPEGYHNGGGYVNQSIATMGGPSITPQTYGQAIDVSGRYLTSNGYVAGVALPPADALRKGYRYWIGGNYVDGNYQGYNESPLYLFNNGTWSNLQTPGMSGATPSGSQLIIPKSGVARLNQMVDLTNYKYLKISGCVPNLSGKFNIGVSQNAAANADGKMTAYTTTQTPSANTYSVAIIDVTALNGFYYIFAYGFYQFNGGMSITSEGMINQVLLSNT